MGKIGKKNKENKVKRSDGLQKKEDDWKEELDNLFDVAHANALEVIDIEEDKEFLIAQREKGRRGKMGNVDLVLSKKELCLEKKKEDLKRRRELAEKEIRSREEKIILASSSSESEMEIDTEQHEDGKGHQPGPSTSGLRSLKRGRKKILDQNLAASLDVAKLSDRNAALVLTPVIKLLGHDPAEYNINPNSIRRERAKHRLNIAENLKVEFTPQVPLTIHWDGKLLEDIVGSETVDRLPILVSGRGIDQLLGVPKLGSGTGEAAATAVYEAAVEWGICDEVKCLGFDTTSVNTGIRNGACILLEQKMDKDMLWLACRHHIYEIMLEAVVMTSLGPSTGPDILLFKRFKKSWTNIDRTGYQTALSDEGATAAVIEISDEMIIFAKSQLLEFQPRDDYKELLELTIVFLGGVPQKGISFKAPAGLHRARWMSKAMYSLKLWMFRSQFKLTKREERGILNICLFVVILYVRVWMTAPASTSAPRNDLQLLKSLDNYKKVNQVIAKVALQKFLGHLWYLSEELVAFGFFDDGVSNETKRKMVRALETEGVENPLKRITVDIAMIQSKELEDFVSSNTRRFFNITGFSSEFLTKDVDMWAEDEVYKEVKHGVRSMRVVNDIAERGVKLMDEYNKLHTNNEEQKQFLLLVVKEYRKRYPDRKKSTLVK